MTITRIGQDHWIERGMRIERARKWLKVTQGELGLALEELLGRTYSRTAVSNIEAGERPLSIDELRVLSHLLGQSEEWLDGEEGATFNEQPPAQVAHNPRSDKLRHWFGRPIEFYLEAA